MLCLVACENKNEEEEIEYIEPINNIVIFDELVPDVRVRILKASNNNKPSNEDFKMIGKTLYQKELVDINGNTIKLTDYDNLLVDVISINCGKCRQQLLDVNKLISDEYTTVLFFDVGTKEEILSLFEELDMEIPEDLIIISENRYLKKYIVDELNIYKYPTMICFKNQKVTFDNSGYLDEDSYEYLIDLGFINPLSEKDFLNNDGINAINLNRTIDDLRSDLSKDNLDRLNKLDNDDYTVELTCQLMSKDLDFDDLQECNSNIYINEVEDFSYYKDKKLVIFYTDLKNVNDTEKIDFFNSLMANDEYEYLMVLIEGLESASDVYKSIDSKFNCPVVSNLSSRPIGFFDFGLASYQTAVFVDRGKYVGAYSNIKNLECFNEALKMFLSDECIAYKKNN